MRDKATLSCLSSSCTGYPIPAAYVGFCCDVRLCTESSKHFRSICLRCFGILGVLAGRGPWMGPRLPQNWAVGMLGVLRM